MKNIDKALYIISHTSDGDDLSTKHLKLTEMAVNGFLNEVGQKAFDELYTQVLNGSYKQPYYHNVEFMTRDHEGYVYFKEQHVEHYTRGWADTLDAKASVEKLQQQCLFLEGIGEDVSFAYSKCHYGMGGSHGLQFGEHQKAELDMKVLNNSILYSKVHITFSGYEEDFMIEGHCDMSEILECEKYKDMYAYQMDNYRYDISDYRIEHLSYGNGETRNADETELILIHSCEDYFFDKELIKKHDEFTVSIKSEQAEIYDDEMEER